MNANTIRLTEQRDEAQSTVRSLETDVRLLRASLDEAQGDARAFEATADRLQGELDRMTTSRDEAVALLRRMVSTHDFVVIGGRCAVCNNDRTKFPNHVDCQNCESAAFLSRLDDGKAGA